MCDKIPDAHDGRMLDSAFLAYVLERYIREDLAYKIKCLRHLVLAYLKHDVSHYKVFFNLYSFFNTMYRHKSSWKYKNDLLRGLCHGFMPLFPKTHRYLIL